MMFRITLANGSTVVSEDGAYANIREAREAAKRMYGAHNIIKVEVN